MKYFIKKTQDFVVDGNPNKAEWQKAESIKLANWPWHDYSKYEPPEVSVKSIYSKNGIYVVFHVKEKFITARYSEYQDNVWQDSCVEFFVAPNSEGYFNFEINCVGTLLLHWNESGKTPFKIPYEDAKNVKIKSSLGRKTFEKPLRCPDSGYIVECFFPFSLLNKYANIKLPDHNTAWKANFYKCGDNTPEPSWGMWTPVNKPSPSFHHPECFGKIVFE